MNKTMKKHLQDSLSNGIRLDGRKLEEFRKLEVETGVVANAEGSARVKLGNTELIAGVKMAVMAPYSDRPDEGTLMVNTELAAMSHERYKLGPPEAEAIEIARVVDRGIRESHAIDTGKLCITKGEKVWMVGVDIVTINADGNLIDAAGIATLAAIKDAFFPEYDGVNVDYNKKTKTKVPLNSEPLPITVFKIGKELVLDPTFNEEEASNARITVTVLEDGTLCSLQKGGDASLTRDDLDKATKLAIKMRKKIKWN
jgi:exosome complex component RRP42